MDYLSAKIGMADVRDCVEAVEDDHGASVRIVLWLHRGEKGERTWRVRAQPVAASGAPVTALQSDGHPWPHSSFRTLSGLLHFLVSQVWERVEYQRLQAARDKEESAA